MNGIEMGKIYTSRRKERYRKLDKEREEGRQGTEERGKKNMQIERRIQRLGKAKCTNRERKVG